MPTPHLVQYQGSKRNIANEIIRYIPKGTKRLIEPFCGTAAVSILAAEYRKVESFILNDINKPLIDMLELCINEPNYLYLEYKKIWEEQFNPQTNKINYFINMRDEFNQGGDPALMLFMLSRVVKGAIRYNKHGQMNQSCDKRRYGTKPEVVRENALKISALLKEKTKLYSMDYNELLRLAEPGDLVYMDPPYQGTSGSNDERYFKSVDYDRFVHALEILNDKGIRYIVSYDDSTGDKRHGHKLPDSLNLIHKKIIAGTSSQSILLGGRDITSESLYLSKGLQDIYDDWRKVDMGEISSEFHVKLDSVTNKRARFVIDKILEKGYCSTEDIKDAGYEHAPRAARDVKDHGIPLDTFKVKDRSGKSIAAYRFGDWEEYVKNSWYKKSAGRTQISRKMKQKLVALYGSICFLYNEEFPAAKLQVDHRIPFEILPNQDEDNADNFMLLSPSGNRTKSWACEHCRNWIEKDVLMCSTCYYSHPEKYEHISGSYEKRIDLIFKSDDEMEIYDRVKSEAIQKGISIQEAFKCYFK